MAQKGRTLILPSGRKLKLRANEVGKKTIFRFIGGRVVPIDLRKVRKSIAIAALGGGIIGAFALSSRAEKEREERKSAVNAAAIALAATIALRIGVQVAITRFGPRIIRAGARKGFAAAMPFVRRRAAQARQAAKFKRLPQRVTKDVTPLGTKVKIRFGK